MKEISISVIIPAYNSEEYISRCVDSILEHNKNSVEVIVIDDASTDNTYNILLKYQDKYPDEVILVRQNENHKQGAARNIGINIARGKYLFFVDSDDYIKRGALDTLYENAEQTSSDIVFCGYETHYMEGASKTAFHVYPMMVGNMTRDRVCALLSSSVVPWGKLIRRCLVTDNQIFFPEDEPYEDLATTYLYYFYAKKTSLVPEYLYVYCQNENSTSNKENKSYHMKYMEMSLLLGKRIEDRKLNLEYQDELDFFYFDQMYILGLEYILKKNHSIDTSDYVQRLLVQLLDKSPNIRNNKYYVRYASERNKNILKEHYNNPALISEMINGGYFDCYCPNYIMNLGSSTTKVQHLFNRITKRITIWGGGKYTRVLIRFLEDIGVKIDRVVDQDYKKIGIQFEGHIVEDINHIESDEIILVPFVFWITNVLARLEREGLKNLILNFESYIKYDILDPIENYWGE